MKGTLRRGVRLPPWLVISLALASILPYGGTWGGITDPDWSRFDILILLTVVGLWLYWRQREGWRWYATPLDRTLPVWGLAFGLSLAANWNIHERSLAGLWFSGLYVLLWYILHDALGNRVITRDALINSLLLAGLPILLGAVHDWLTGIPRVFNPLENPNIMGAFLVMFIPVIAGAALAAQGARRVWLLAYFAVALFVAYMTGSRGAWLGLLASGGVVAAFYFPRIRLPMVTIAVPLVIGLVGLRGGTGRVEIFSAALEMFARRPLTGYGLYTFRMIDPHEGLKIIHMHTHNAFLNIGVELGIIGLFAFVMTIIAVGRAVLRTLDSRNIWLVAALAGAAAHQMVDFAIMMPSIALVFLMILCIAAHPEVPGEPIPAKRGIAALVALALLLIGVGLLAGGMPKYFMWL